jgi:RNA polymerase sigma factor (sigma-70 family)
MSATQEPSQSDLDVLFARARSGDEAAWRELFEACYPKVIRVVRRKLGRPMRSLYDSTDFASDVMTSLAANAKELDFDSFSSLIAFLVRVAEQKVIDGHRRVHTQKRNVDLERPIDATDGAGDGPMPLESPEPTASQFAQASEANERLLAGRSGPERAAIELKKEGYSPSEIAKQIGWHIRTVQRFFKDLRESFVGPIREAS